MGAAPRPARGDQAVEVIAPIAEVAPVEIEILRLDDGLATPINRHAHDAGYDLHARDEVTLASGGGRALIPTGVAFALPVGWAGFVQPRSGLALRHGVTVLNTPGLIDAGYRDELRVILVNTDPEADYVVKRGDRIAQLVVQRVAAIRWVEVAALPAASRGAEGFGSTGR